MTGPRKDAAHGKVVYPRTMRIVREHGGETRDRESGGERERGGARDRE